MMIKTYWVAAVLAISLMSYAQYRGWNLFSESGSAARPGSTLRTFHK